MHSKDLEPVHPSCDEPHERVYRALVDVDAQGWGGKSYLRRAAGWRDDLGDMMRRALIPAAPAVVLELGCGNGLVSGLLAAQGYHCAGIDISPTAIEWARLRFREAGLTGAFNAGPVTDLGIFVDNSLDLVVDGNCLHCVVGDDRAACLSEVRRVLKPSGRFVVSSMVGPPRELPTGSQYDLATQVLERADGCLRVLQPIGDLIAALRSAGFEVVDRRVSSNAWWDHALLVLE